MSWVTNLMLHVSSALDSAEGRRFWGDAVSSGPVFHPDTPPELKDFVNSTLGNILGNLGGFSGFSEKMEHGVPRHQHRRGTGTVGCKAFLDRN